MQQVCRQVARPPMYKGRRGAGADEAAIRDPGHLRQAQGIRRAIIIPEQSASARAERVAAAKAGLGLEAEHSIGEWLTGRC